VGQRPARTVGSRWRGRLERVLDRAVERAVDARLTSLEQHAEQRHAELLREMRAWERRTRRDVWTALEQEAARTSADLVRREMHQLTLSTDPHQTLRDAVRAAPADGLALEFGVATGTTLRIIAEHRGQQPVFGFDSFEGLPEHWRLGYEAGAFAQPPPVVPGAELVVGQFADTLPGFLAEHPGPVSFVHVDCDLYSSTATVLEHLGPRFVVGTVVAFDEYFNFPGWQEFEHRAWTEHVARTGLEFEYAGLTMDDEQVWVRVTNVRQRSVMGAT
jgi:hypothetical protein